MPSMKTSALPLKRSATEADADCHAVEKSKLTVLPAVFDQITCPWLAPLTVLLFSRVQVVTVCV